MRPRGLKNHTKRTSRRPKSFIKNLKNQFQGWAVSSQNNGNFGGVWATFFGVFIKERGSQNRNGMGQKRGK